MDKQVTSGQFIKNAGKVKGVEEQKRQTITVSSNFGHFWDLNKTEYNLIAASKQYCGRTTSKAY
jgi:hypothetical protein